jgi:hypothetical protein
MESQQIKELPLAIQEEIDASHKKMMESMDATFKKMMARIDAWLTEKRRWPAKK